MAVCNTRRPVHLSPREAQVLALAARGLSITDTADLLRVSRGYVVQLRSRINAKAGVARTADALELVAEHGVHIDQDTA
jgi:DNA-binding CsgD family transcriptional regulator